MTLADVKAATQFVPRWHETGACMDRRHILWLYDVLVLTGVQRTLEIGTHTGASASAFIAARIPDAQFADPSMTAEALTVIQGRGTFHQARGCDVMLANDTYDLVLVDGNHSMEAVCEEILVLLKKPPAIIVAHDVCSTAAGFAHCEGAAYLRETLTDDGWTCIVDDAKRDGEMTHRGLLMATKDQGLADLISGAWSMIK
jgi:hypothetical protein